MLRPGVEAVLRRTQPGFAKYRTYADDPRKFLDLMDAEGIERACLINYVAPSVVGYTHEANAWVHAYAKADRKRLIPFGSLHPEHVENAAKAIDELLSKYELGGIKIHPPHMLVAPNAYQNGMKALELLYDACQAAGVPVMFHTGTSNFPGARTKFGDPLLVDDVAIDFPRLQIILAHGGRPLWTETAAFLVRRHPNVWLEISSIPPQNLLKYFPRLEDLSEKTIFGSDWPGPHVPGMRANADAVAALPLSDAAMQRILYGNAQRLLKKSAT